MSGGAGRPASFFDELTNKFRRAHSSLKDIFGEDALYGMYSLTSYKIEKEKRILLCQSILGNKDFLRAMLVVETTYFQNIGKLERNERILKSVVAYTRNSFL